MSQRGRIFLGSLAILLGLMANGLAQVPPGSVPAQTTTPQNSSPGRNWFDTTIGTWLDKIYLSTGTWGIRGSLDQSGNYIPYMNGAPITATSTNALPLTGGTMTGKIVTATSTSARAGLNLPPGTAPSSSLIGDIWETLSGLYANIDGIVGNLLFGPNNLSDVANTSTSRANLGLKIGTNVEAWNASLDAIGAGTWIGASSITTLGTVTSGLWEATPIANAYLAYSSITVNGQTCSLGGSCGTTTAPTITVETSGSGTYATRSGVLWLKITLIGGGGGGGGTGSGTGNGGTGGNTTLCTVSGCGSGTVFAADGGGGGTFGNSGSTGTGGSGGTASGCSVALQGGNGSGGMEQFAAGADPGGTGASSPFGGAGGGNYNQQAAGITNTGSGGAGGWQNSGSGYWSGGGGGAGGYCTGVIASPAADYYYTVGAAGAAGTGAISTGGAGGSGILVIEEHYNY